jgi:hypothetical protein
MAVKVEKVFARISCMSTSAYGSLVGSLGD